MHKFIMENDYPDQLPTTVEFTVPSDADLNDMLEQFELYLKAVGFNFDGNLDIVPPEDKSYESRIDYNMWDNRTTSYSLNSATPEEWDKAYRNVKVNYKSE